MDLFLQNSENIKELIQLMIIHEKNVANHLSNANEGSMDLSPGPILSNTYTECEYGMLPIWAKYPRVSFKPEDPMILIKECGHSCRKEHFLQWIKDHHTCMDCSTLL
jgi:hypothetical protein